MNTAYQVSTQEASVQIGVAATLAEKREIFRFRYRVYVEEMGMRLTSADHSNKLLYDDLDTWGILLYAKSAAKILGTMRVNIGPLNSFPPDLAEILSLHRFLKSYEKKETATFSYNSKLMIDHQHRNSIILHLLMTKGYELCYDHHIKYSFGICNFHLLRLYEQFGLRRFSRPIVAPGYSGVLMPFVMLVGDIDHLRAVRSPYYRLARKRPSVDNRTGEWFKNEFPEQNTCINSQLVSEDDLWNHIGNRLQNPPHLAIQALNGLTAAEARAFLHRCGILIPFRPGDHIALAGCASQTLNILLNGKIALRDETAAATVHPGQCFGAAGLAAPRESPQDIIAATDAEILVLSSLSFPKFRHTHPAVADKILANLDNLSGAENSQPAALIPPRTT